jgi:hypothetical protein
VPVPLPFLVIRLPLSFFADAPLYASSPNTRSNQPGLGKQGKQSMKSGSDRDESAHTARQSVRRVGGSSIRASPSIRPQIDPHPSAHRPGKLYQVALILTRHSGARAQHANPESRRRCHKSVDSGFAPCGAPRNDESNFLQLGIIPAARSAPHETKQGAPDARPTARDARSGSSQ